MKYFVERDLNDLDEFELREIISENRIGFIAFVFLCVGILLGLILSLTFGS